MGAIKIEFDVPEFKEQLSINIVIRKDGEVVRVESTSTFPTLPSDSVDASTGDKKAPTTKKRRLKEENIVETQPENKKLGNMMSFDF